MRMSSMFLLSCVHENMLEVTEQVYHAITRLMIDVPLQNASPNHRCDMMTYTVYSLHKYLSEYGNISRQGTIVV